MNNFYKKHCGSTSVHAMKRCYSFEAQSEIKAIHTLPLRTYQLLMRQSSWFGYSWMLTTLESRKLVTDPS